MAALLHDLGMARVPKELLAKPTELTDEEREVIEHHPVDGARSVNLDTPADWERAEAMLAGPRLRPAVTS